MRCILSGDSELSMYVCHCIAWPGWQESQDMHYNYVVSVASLGQRESLNSKLGACCLSLYSFLNPHRHTGASATASNAEKLNIPHSAVYF